MFVCLCFIISRRCLYYEYNEIFTRKNNIERNDVGQGRDFSGVFSIENETPFFPVRE